MKQTNQYLKNKPTTKEHFRQMTLGMIEKSLIRWSNDDYKGNCKFLDAEAQKQCATRNAIDFLMKQGWYIGTDKELSEARKQYAIEIQAKREQENPNEWNILKEIEAEAENKIMAEVELSN